MGHFRKLARSSAVVAGALAPLLASAQAPTLRDVEPGALRPGAG
jgi:hypothetical protein